MPPTVVWDANNQGHNRYALSTLTQLVPACTTLMVTSGQLTLPDGTMCGYQADQLCVFVVRASTSRTVGVSGLIPGHTWYGLTRSAPDAALGDKQAQFFADNCAGGCAIARVWVLTAGPSPEYQELRP